MPNIFSVTSFGAIGDGKTLATEAFQKAIDECGKSRQCKHVTVTNCSLSSASSVFRIGVGKHKGISDITIDNFSASAYAATRILSDKDSFLKKNNQTYNQKRHSLTVPLFCSGSLFFEIIQKVCVRICASAVMIYDRQPYVYVIRLYLKFCAVCIKYAA